MRIWATVSLKLENSCVKQTLFLLKMRLLRSFFPLFSNTGLSLTLLLVWQNFCLSFSHLMGWKELNFCLLMLEELSSFLFVASLSLSLLLVCFELLRLSGLATSRASSCASLIFCLAQHFFDKRSLIRLCFGSLSWDQSCGSSRTIRQTTCWVHRASFCSQSLTSH